MRFIVEIIWSKQVDAILGVGHSLEAEGIRNFALRRTDALNALDQLEVLGIPVAGGDVFVDQCGRLKMNYDNWFCNSIPGESHSEYARRSIARARDYIQRYQVSDAYFALVPGPRPEME